MQYIVYLIMVESKDSSNYSSLHCHCDEKEAAMLYNFQTFQTSSGLFQLVNNANCRQEIKDKLESHPNKYCHSVLIYKRDRTLEG